MNLPPNRVKENRVWRVRHTRYRSKEWLVLAKSAAFDKEKAEKAHESGPCQQDADEAKRVVLSENERLAYADLTAEEARG